MKKTASALVLVGSLAFFGAGAASAVENYPAPPACGTVSDASVAPGTTVTFSGSCHAPNESIRLDVDYSNAPIVVPGTGVNGVIILAEIVSTSTINADAQGAFSADIPLGEAGTYTLTATGMESGIVATAVVTVEEADNGAEDNNADEGDLADTGADSAMLLWGAAGIVAVGAGVASVAVARRKNA